MAGLALPTAAAAALAFTATGAAVATSTKTQAVTVSHNAAATPVARATSNGRISSSAAAMGDPRAQAIADNALVIDRADAAATAARSANRNTLAARDLASRRLKRAHSWQSPIKKIVRSSRFGWRWGRLHAGEDFAAPVGTKLVSMSTGTVTFAGQESGYGNLVKIRYWDGTVTFYAHMSHISVNEGEDVDPGEVVGLSGNTGHSTGPHLHLEIHPGGGEAIDPLPWLANHHIAA